MQLYLKFFFFSFYTFKARALPSPLSFACWMNGCLVTVRVRQKLPHQQRVSFSHSGYSQHTSVVWSAMYRSSENSIMDLPRKHASPHPQGAWFGRSWCPSSSWIGLRSGQLAYPISLGTVICPSISMWPHCGKWYSFLSFCWYRIRRTLGPWNQTSLESWTLWLCEPINNFDLSFCL